MEKFWKFKSSNNNKVFIPKFWCCLDESFFRSVLFRLSPQLDLQLSYPSQVSTIISMFIQAQPYPCAMIVSPSYQSLMCLHKSSEPVLPHLSSVEAVSNFSCMELFNVLSFSVLLLIHLNKTHFPIFVYIINPTF